MHLLVDQTKTAHGLGLIPIVNQSYLQQDAGKQLMLKPRFHSAQKSCIAVTHVQSMLQEPQENSTETETSGHSSDCC